MTSSNNLKIPLYAKGFKYFKSAVKYAKDVCEGKIIVSESPRLECKRFLTELELQKDKNYPYYFDKVAGEKICSFLETLQHVKGKWARGDIQSRYLHLEPWQCFICVNIFGWKKRIDDLRRYMLAYLELPRKQGKSFFSAGFGLYMFAVDGEAGAEVYCGATSLDQAMHVFKPASLMVERNEFFKKKYKVNVKKEFMDLPDGSIFKPIVGSAHDGSSPHCAILDEVHEHPNDELFQSQITGLGSRDQPLVLLITTAGKNIESFCKEQHDYVFKNQQTELKNQDLTTFGMIYTIDKDDDPFTLEALKKANPNYGVSCKEDYLLRQLDIAKRSPKDRADYLTKNLNVWLNAKSAFFDMQQWNECADETLNIDDFINDDLFLSFDLSAKYDMTTIILNFVRKINGYKHSYIFMYAYLPTDTIEDVTNFNYKLYQKYVQMQSHNCPYGTLLTPIAGSEVDTDYLYEELVMIIKKFKRVKEIAYDPWRTPSVMNKLAKNFGFLRDRIVEMTQNTKNLNAGMKEAQSAIVSKRIHHDGNPILAWHVSNVISKEDNKGNDFPTKANKNAKIDGAVCMIMTQNRVELYNPTHSLTDRILNRVAIGSI